MKNNFKPLLRHEILNQLTLIRFLISSEPDFDINKKEEIDQLIHMTSLLVSHHDFIVGGRSDFFTEIFDLCEVLETIHSMYEGKMADIGVTIEPLHEKAMVQADKSMTKELIEVIMRHIFKISHSVRFRFDPGISELTIEHGGEALKISNMAVVDCLKRKEMTLREKILIITVRLAEGTDIRVENHPKEVKIRFTGFLYNAK